MSPECSKVDLDLVIRNGEIVLDTHLVTHFVWQEKTGAIRTVRTAHGPNWQDEWSTRVDHDVPWLAMTNELDDFGVAAIGQSPFAFNNAEFTILFLLDERIQD